MTDDGPAISYKLLEPGARVVTSDGLAVGTVTQILDNVREDIFDGLVVRCDRGEIFVDAPEVDRITETTVTLTIDGAAADELPIHRPGAPEFRANPKAGRLGRFFGGGWKRQG
jgi:hypothetical protein